MTRGGLSAWVSRACCYCGASWISIATSFCILFIREAEGYPQVCESSAVRFRIASTRAVGAYSQSSNLKYSAFTQNGAIPTAPKSADYPGRPDGLPQPVCGAHRLAG